MAETVVQVEKEDDFGNASSLLLLDHCQRCILFFFVFLISVDGRPLDLWGGTKNGTRCQYP